MIKRNYFSLLLILAILALSTKLHAQSQQLTIYPDKDAKVNSLMANRNTNFGTNQYFDASSWTTKGAFSNERSLIQFDVSSIPSNAVIESASLYLYGSNHSQSSTNGNACYLKMLTSYWDEEFVTWNNQPLTTLDSLQKLAISDSVIAVPASFLPNQNYTIDIKKFVEYWVKGKIENLGLQLKLQNENPAYNILNFYSSDYSNASLRPKVVIVYHVDDLQDATFTQDKNWVRTITYLENGDVASENVVFADFLGKTTQIQQRMKNSDNTNYLIVNQIVYDASNRPALSTLPAAVNANLGVYINDFITPSGNDAREYNYTDFTLFTSFNGDVNEGEVNHPKSVSSSSVLGNYYSNNNTMENYVGTTSFPYSAAYYGINQKEDINKISSAGDTLRMGKGHEIKSYKVYAAPNELYANGCGSGADESFPVPAYKIITTDNNGNVKVAYYNMDDQIIATCEPDHNKTPYMVTGKILMPGFVDIHLPADMPSLENYKVYLTRVGQSAAATFFDIEKKEPSGDVLFNNVNVGEINLYWPCYNGAGYYRINATTTDSYDAMLVEYYLNYSNFKLYKNDKAGRIIKSTAGSYGGSEYYYNAMGLLTSETNADRGTTNYTYYDDGKLHFKITANQHEKISLSYIVYDEVNRPTETGEHIFPDLASLNQYVENPNAESSEALISSSKDVNKTFYDIADADFYTITGLLPADYKQTNLWGRVSLTTNLNNTTWYSYDMQGRLLWMVQNINNLAVKTIDYVYNDKGLLEKTVYQKKLKVERFDHIFIYDNNVRLAEVKTFTYTGNISVYKSQARYLYYKHGPLKRVEIADNLQGMDYVYTVNGWLKSINNPSLYGYIDPGLDGQPGNHQNFKQDIFGMTLDYFAGDYMRNNTNILPINTTNNYYNGNVKAMCWKTNNNVILANNELVLDKNAEQVVYKFDYDKNNWLTSADFGYGVATNGVVQFRQSKQAGAYDMEITYDINGNIKTLNRNAYDNNNNNNPFMDRLTYFYDDGVNNKSNRLKFVQDNSTNNTYTTDIKTQSPNNYEYNANGELIANKQDSLYFVYNHIGLVTDVYKNSALTILKAKYLYDERGHRLKKTVYNSSTITTTWYINDAAGNVLNIKSYTNASESGPINDFPIYGMSRIGMYRNNSGQYTYDITDNLGNVRAVIKKSTSGGVEFVSATDYYPWGMEMPGRMYNSTSNRYGYQGEYSEKDPETGLNTFDLRQFDSRLGRWLIPDPMYEFNNPYIGMGNNPVSIVDPTGGHGGGQQAREVRQRIGTNKDGTGIYLPEAAGTQATACNGGGSLSIGGSIAGGENTGPSSIGEGSNGSFPGGSAGGNNSRVYYRSDEVRMRDQLRINQEKAANEKMRLLNALHVRNYIAFMGKPHKNIGFGSAEPGPGDDADPGPGEDFKIYYIYESLTPQIYNNTKRHLEERPWLSTLTYNGGGKIARANRYGLLKGTDICMGANSRDEFPYASTEEGGLGNAWVECVPIHEQSVQGAYLRWLYNDMKAGEKFRIVLVPDPDKIKQKQPKYEIVPFPKKTPNPIFPMVITEFIEIIETIIITL
jgi:RHS repeat-associated protein